MSSVSAATEYWAQSDNELSSLLSTAVWLEKSTGLAILYKSRGRAASIQTRRQTSHQKPRLTDTCEPCHWYDPIIPNETTCLLQYLFGDATGLSSWRCGMFSNNDTPSEQMMSDLKSSRREGCLDLEMENTLGLSVQVQVWRQGTCILSTNQALWSKTDQLRTHKILKWCAMPLQARRCIWNHPKISFGAHLLNIVSSWTEFSDHV